MIYFIRPVLISMFVFITVGDWMHAVISISSEEMVFNFTFRVCEHVTYIFVILFHCETAPHPEASGYYLVF